MGYGGARKGAGRPGQFGCKTKPIRVPETLIGSIQKYLQHQGYKLPLYSSKVAAGFPSSVDDSSPEQIDLIEYLVKRPSETFLVRVAGSSMIDAGIFEDDILIVDRSVVPEHGKIVIAAIDGQLTVKRLLRTSGGQSVLMPENPAFSPLEINDQSNIYIWGVVRNVIHAV